jgi:outer membrane protein assembly factor BamD (BamD/ComL family)
MKNRALMITTVVAIAPMMASVQAMAQTVEYRPLAIATVPSTKRIPEPADLQDPAVALYRSARSALTDGNYDRAAELFRSIRQRYPKSTYTPDAYYWEAFSLYKSEEYGKAREILKEQITKYPKAATAQDAKSLLARLNGIIVKTTGNPEIGVEVSKTAKASVGQGCPNGDDDDDMRVAALNAVLNMNADQALPLLKRIIEKKDACSAGLRRKAVFLISQKRNAETEDILLSVARNDPDKEVRSQAVFWLSQVNTEKATSMLEDILRTSNDSEVRDKAIFALSQQNNARAQKALRDYASNQNAPQELREKAVFWIGQRRGDENAEFLKDLYAKERSQELKDKIIFSLSQQKGNESWLMAQAMNENESMEVRKKALFWAGQSRNTSLAELTGLYDKITNRELKDQLIFVYSQRREPAAVDKMMDIAKNEKDRELRKKALFWLGQSKDPRVADFLMQLINQ